MYIEKSVLKYFKENSNKGLSMEAQIELWIEEASKSVIEKSQAEWPTCKLNHRKLVFTKGRKYYKLILENLDGEGQRSVYCFLDKEGNIYKADGWSKPAKGIRGNIANKPASEVQVSTFWLYR